MLAFYTQGIELLVIFDSVNKCLTVRIMKQYIFVSRSHSAIYSIAEKTLMPEEDKKQGLRISVVCLTEAAGAFSGH